MTSHPAFLAEKAGRFPRSQECVVSVFPKHFHRNPLTLYRAPDFLDFLSPCFFLTLPESRITRVNRPQPAIRDERTEGMKRISYIDLGPSMMIMMMRPHTWGSAVGVKKRTKNPDDSVSQTSTKMALLMVVFFFFSFFFRRTGPELEIGLI